MFGRLLAVILYQRKLDMELGSGIAYQLRYIYMYSICRYCWNVATCKVIVDGNIEIISVVVKFRFEPPLAANSRVHVKV
jgi:hypothetical protein